MTKEQFIKRMSLIQNFQSEQNTISKLIEKFSDGFCVVTIGNYLVDELINMINESLYIEDSDLLVWWLYEDVDKVIYDRDIKISVKTLEELYNYISDTYVEENQK